MGIESRVIQIIKENLENSPEVKAESKLQDDLGIDSLEAMMIINAIEDEFEISIEDDDFRELKTVQDILDILKKELSYKYFNYILSPRHFTELALPVNDRDNICRMNFRFFIDCFKSVVIFSKELNSLFDRVVIYQF